MSLLLAFPPGGGALAQGQPLAPPALPSTLPGGTLLPALPPGTQQDILQRILDAAGGRPASPAPPAAIPAPVPNAPFQPTAIQPGGVPQPPLRADMGEPLSNTEAFFAALDQQNELRFCLSPLTL
ncbi:hypothetical protein J8J14_17630 [Roseomonas sp. SSH11]|uniref:Uncharacterized protein n=2 Tax=Pararoseomonas baculiformis TaxID=2820812 RepID=A0ABS4AI92_9PROT|nr:hypothetical protein [Pararoseomonas baculiformis]